MSVISSIFVQLNYNNVVMLLAKLMLFLFLCAAHPFSVLAAPGHLTHPSISLPQLPISRWLAVSTFPPSTLWWCCGGKKNPSGRPVSNLLRLEVKSSGDGRTALSNQSGFSLWDCWVNCGEAFRLTQELLFNFALFFFYNAEDHFYFIFLFFFFFHGTRNIASELVFTFIQDILIAPTWS